MRFRHVFFRVAAPRKPRHRLLRLLLGVLGLALLLVLIAFGVFVGAAMLAAGALLRLWTLKRKAPARKDEALPGDFRVISKPALPAR
ncbi:hypothetical protein FNZ56_06900 [Pseudoluteimonas lycopersici]|uniref:Uncharacterized protein n=1 Tax=Pseudoluteimonas lycopersici TaxID=1324796 RepID=A0A516V509_9GAMM|nr:hypothetical protein [Lysobacter lycopersici]QDQ73620.1 hypothetical protein FNZ56_06900 [Lysobacter lycopersici]